MTTGCTIEAHNFQRDLAKYDAKKAVILGVSMQDEKSHQEFCAKESLTFKLLADTNKEVSEKYDSVMNLGVAKLSARHTYLIDPNGVVRKVWTSVDVKTHSDDVLASLDELQKPAS
jgi:thioredoxin-dependent peroxiredoxin